jgi:S-adenosylmethionine:tRNA ribosyltransferase-isomerase
MTQPRPGADPNSVWKGEIDYELPRELIAQHPVAVRDHSRLMVLDRKAATIEHHRFSDIGALIATSDVLVANDSRVIPARLFAKKSTGGSVEFLVLDAATSGPVTALARSSKRLVIDQQLELASGGHVRIAELVTGGRVKLDFGSVSALEVLQAQGEIPLPPYIERPDGPTPDDLARYQTVYCRSPGSVAAPTAGLHFTPDLLANLADAGVAFERVTLHVGPGTFSPVRGALDAHRMDPEYCIVDEETVSRIEDRRARGGRVVAVGTTSVRTLESAAAAGRLAPYAGPTDLFIRPGHRFNAVDALITNFHLPGSTLLCLVMALAGEELIRRAYARAIAEKYRFYSYGDAMLIV